MHKRRAGKTLKRGKLVVDKVSGKILEVLAYFEHKFGKRVYVTIDVVDLEGNKYTKNHKQIKEL
jgi:hypothetical protein